MSSKSSGYFCGFSELSAVVTSARPWTCPSDALQFGILSKIIPEDLYASAKDTLLGPAPVHVKQKAVHFSSSTGITKLLVDFHHTSDSYSTRTSTVE